MRITFYFDETKYSEGQSLVFECEHCGKQFSIRFRKSKVKALRKEENLEEEAEVHKEEFGYITVIENVFGSNKYFHCKEGDNVIGRRCVGTVINTPIESGDMSMDRRHCHQCKAQQARKAHLYIAGRPQPDGYFSHE